MKIVDTTKKDAYFNTLSNGQVCKIEWDDGSTSYLMKIEPIKDAEYCCVYDALDVQDGVPLEIGGDTLVTPLDAELRLV